MAQIIQIRRDIANNWKTANPILAQGEQGLEIDTLQFKFGDGIRKWNDLPYSGNGGGSNMIDGGAASSVFGGTEDINGGGA